MKKLFVIIFSVLFLLPTQARADCATVSNANTLTLDIPCMEFSGARFGVVLAFYSNPLDSAN
ncbi:MAG: hypothetical protein HQK65_18340, partial [Desulfamplus sp.]|nr:hypothetical protein [Desulfamplus sp.]